MSFFRHARSRSLPNTLDGPQICTGISGELIQANKALADNPGLMSEEVRPCSSLFAGPLAGTFFI